MTTNNRSSDIKVSGDNNGLCPICGGEHVDRYFNKDVVRIALESGGFITTRTLRLGRKPGPGGQNKG